VKSWFQHAVLSRRWATFIVMGLAFLAFGAGTLNLFIVARANFQLLADHGWMAVMDGGGRQLLELLLTGYLSLLAYLVFKACEYSLVHWLGEAPNPMNIDIEKDPHEDRDPPR
jgi:hypothetical protein